MNAPDKAVVNMHIWNAVCRPPETALKAINTGRLKGKTDINPQWRMKAMTEVFGPCGTGWKYSIDKLWTEAGSADQVMAFALVSLQVRKGEHWSEPIPGIGGATLIARETAGLHSNDEAYKMAVTDALSVAMKSLGVAADIYAGLWDGSKYKTQLPGVIKPTDGALESLPTDMQTSAKDDADYIRKMWEEDKEAAFDAYISLLDGDATYTVAVWSLLADAPGLRNGLKKMKKERENA